MVTYRQPFEGTFPITQRYGEIVEGVTYKGLPHTGIDYGCPSDTPILASADGVVKAAKNDPSGYGKYIILEHPDGKATLYAHLWYFNNLFEGKQVKQGDVIAYSDSSGNSTGPHLHFEARAVWNDAKSHRDPITFLPLMSQVSAVSNQVSVLKGAAAFDEGDTVKIEDRGSAGCEGILSGIRDKHLLSARDAFPVYRADRTTQRLHLHESLSDDHAGLDRGQ